MSFGRPHATVPYPKLGTLIELVRQNGLNPEIFLSSGCLDGLDEVARATLAATVGHGTESSIHGPFMDLCPGALDRKVRDITAERFARTLDVAALLRSKSVVFHAGYEKWKFGHKIEQWLDASVEFWPALIEQAQRCGMRIVVENVFEHEPEPLAALMERLGCMHFGVCFDIGHFNLFTKTTLKHWLDALGPHVMQLHLHDNDGGYDSHLPLGEGSIRYDELFKWARGRELIYTLEARSAADLIKSKASFMEMMGL